MSVDLVSVWWACWTSRKTMGADGLVALAMHILSIVPNSAATEQLFSLMGTIHTDQRNCLNAKRVQKMVMVKGDINTQFPPKDHKKHSLTEEHGITDDSPESRTSSQDQPASPAGSPGKASASFNALTQGLLCNAEEHKAAAATGVELASRSVLSGHKTFFLFNLFVKPTDPDFISLHSYCAGFWNQAEGSLDIESDLQESLMRGSSSMTQSSTI